MSRFRVVLLALIMTAVSVSCDLVDPMRPSIQPDSETFGNLLEVNKDAEEPGVWIATIKIGVPRAMGRADGAEPTPNVAGGLTAVVRVTSETVVIVDDRPAALEDIAPGTEVVAIPSPGTTTVFGDSEVHQTAEQLLDFASYARWRLPRLELADPAGQPVEDPARVNTAGVETAPIPVGDGTVLYFTARLRPGVVPGRAWLGARRQGLDEPAEGGASFDRCYRTELSADGWTVPELVRFDGIEETDHVKLTWINADETRCYLTVSDANVEPWVGVATRSSPTDAWSEVVPLAATGGGDAFDAVAMSGAPGKTLFATTRSGGGDIFLHDPEMGQAQRLQPEINSGRLEWAPRTGPEGELYFVRVDRQLRFKGGNLDEVRLPGPHRSVITEAVPTADGAWLFFAQPKLRPVTPDFDIFVAPLDEAGSPGKPVPVDDWRPNERQ